MADKSVFIVTCPNCKGEMKDGDERLCLPLYGMLIHICNFCGVLFLEEKLIPVILCKARESAEKRIELATHLPKLGSTH